VPATYYPAVLERGEGAAFAVWFLDFPSEVAGAVSQTDAMSKAEAALGSVDKPGPESKDARAQGLRQRRDPP
jgi:hypothetical protein